MSIWNNVLFKSGGDCVYMITTDHGR